MKSLFKAGLLSAAVLGVLSLSPAAHAAGYSSVNPAVPNNLSASGGAAVVATSELPINRGVGRGSNKAMLDLNRGYGTAVTSEPMSGYYAMNASMSMANRDRYGVQRENYTQTRDNRYYDERRYDGYNRASYDRGMRYRDGRINARAYGSDGVSVSGGTRSNVNSDIYTNPPIGEGSNRANSSLDVETR